ncbi:hypothetical protein CMQ_6639 [Grosmannia clavigera kw1407]|uniref:Uncharacterized protein n=1 Tax=Grosmannia clavigera (strain kw1407 / UAMH 11150) TaxID=655863 RepID=F0X7U7_GROCL|nr:uncharacterized protein CMQ_6639 [Grosmannia clavigera kw1407]EFX06318.1 hypothetical protein CMQ_6639 [Grosmannia clavigera kw1407]
MLHPPSASLSSTPFAASVASTSHPSMASRLSASDWSYDAGNPAAETTIPGSSQDASLYPGYHLRARNTNPATISPGLDGVGLDPMQYLRSRGCGKLLPNSSPQQYLSPPVEIHFHAMPSSALPSNCGSLTEDTGTDTATSSRVSESYQGSVFGALDMVQVNSQDSFSESPLVSQDIKLPRRNYDDLAIVEQPLDSDVAVLGIGTGYSLAAQFSQSSSGQSASHFPGNFFFAMEPALSLDGTSYCLNTTDGEPEPGSDGAEPRPQHHFTDMERSESNGSTRSTSSYLSARAKDTLRRQNSAARRFAIQPRASASAPESTILRSQNALEDGPEPSNRDAAALGKKEILKARRTHFKKKVPRKGSHQASPTASSAAEDEANTDWPPMPDLKCWMKEVIVPVGITDAIAETDGGEKDESTSPRPKNRSRTVMPSFAGSTLPIKLEEQAESFGLGNELPNIKGTRAVVDGNTTSGSSSDLQNEMTAEEMGPAFDHGLLSSATFLELHQPYSNFAQFSHTFVGSLSEATEMTSVPSTLYHNCKILGNDFDEFNYSKDSPHFDFMPYNSDSNAFS